MSHRGRRLDLKVSSLLQIPNLRVKVRKVVSVIATLSGKQTHSEDNADSGVPFITRAGPRQSLLLAKDPDQHS